MRLIDADELKKSIEEDEELKGNSLAYLLMNLMTCYIDDSITIDAEPVRHGHWTKYGYCSICGGEQLGYVGDGCYGFLDTDYCPHCGAKMDGQGE